MRAQTVINGRYEIKDTLGQGGMGIVFRAYDISTRRNVALKTMRDSADPIAVELFAKEWNVLANLSHPNIVDILDVGEFEMSGKRRPFFVMPLLPGKTLTELIASSSQRLTVERVAEIMVQTCRGLMAAHERGLIHRDLKPSNIFVMDDDTAKIIDFGVVHLSGSHSVTGVKGTLQYMAPEQLEMKPATPQSDIFSLGVVTYEAITGRKPFARGTDAATAEAVRTHIPPAASELNPAANELVSRVIHKAIAKQPWHRFDTAREFADALRKAVRNEPIERFERLKILPRIQRAAKAFQEGDLQFAEEILSELEAEGNIDPEMVVLRMQLDQASRHRTIRQLLESARIRCEQEEYPLALQKLQEVLAIDPDNADALRLRGEIEGQRSERQLENWLRLLEQHLHGGAFADARKCLDEALKLSPDDSRVKRAHVELQRREEHAEAARAQKDQLYNAAKEAFRNGEISTALSKLERILSLNQSEPDRLFPERDARYQQLYNQVRNEHDAMRMSFEEARRALSAKDFQKALAICDEYLTRYPSQALFQALRLEITEQERQELSACIADTARRLDVEPDLDRKLAILEDAAQRYPEEAHFQKSLKLLRERRDLVLSIVTKARQYEERGQFAEAIAQWKIVASIYPPYPGLSFEIEQLERRRELQNRDEAKARWTGELQSAVEAGDFERVIELSRRALSEHPGDPEIQALLRAAQDGLNKRAEAGRLLKEGAALCESGDYAGGIGQLRRALELDERNESVRRELANALVAQARTIVTERSEEAESLVQEALRVEPNHAAGRGLRAVIQDSRRRAAVNRTLGEARELQLRREYAEAVRTIDECLVAYPNEARLLQLRELLIAAAKEAKQQPKAEPAPEPPPEVKAAAAAAGGTPAKTLAFESATAIETVVDANPPPQTTPPKPPFPMRFAAAVLAILLVLVAAGWWGVRTLRTRTAPPPVSVADYPVQIETNVASANILIDGRTAGQPPYRLTAGPHVLEISADGYQAVRRQIDVGPDSAAVHVELTPEPLSLRVITALPRGKVMFDGRELGALEAGAFTKDDIEAAEHDLRIMDGALELIQTKFRSAAGTTAEVHPPVRTPGLLLVSSLGSRVVIYAGPGPLKVSLKGEPLQPVPAEGLPLTGIQADAELVVSNGKTERVIPLTTGNSPSLTLIASDATQAGSLLTISSTIDDAVVSINGQPSRWRFTNSRLSRRLSPGKYTVKLSKEGYFDEERLADLTKGDTKLTFELKPIPTVAALVIAGGTPSAEVWIGRTQGGVLDAQGNINLERIAPGDHEITLRKQQFEPKGLKRSFTAGQTVHISGEDAKLRPFGALQFQIEPSSAEVTFRRDDETEYRSAKSGQSAPVREGRYRVRASAPSFAPRDELFTVEAGRSTPVTMSLVRVAEVKPERAPAPAAGSLFDSTWTREDSMWTYTGQGYGWLRASRGTFDIDVQKKSARLGFGGTIEWVVGLSADGKDKVVYRLGRDGWLRRQATVAGRTLAEVRSAHRVSGDEVFRLRIAIEPRRVVVRDRSAGDVIDDYAHSGVADLTQGRFGFRRGVRLTATLAP